VMTPWWMKVDFGDRPFTLLPLPHPAYLLRVPAQKTLMYERVLRGCAPTSNERCLMSIPEPAPELVARAESLSVRNVTVQVSAKRTVKVGDDFRSFESSMTVTFTIEGRADSRWMRRNWRRIHPDAEPADEVYTDLWIGG